MEFIQSEKNKKNVKIKRVFRHKFDKKYKNTSYWICNADKCRSRLNLKMKKLYKGQVRLIIQSPI